MDSVFIKKNKVAQSWEQFLISADSDYVAALLNYITGKQDSTSLWIAEQAIEKYLKCWALKEDAQFDPKRYNNHLLRVWSWLKDRFPDNEVFLGGAFNVDFNSFIEELNTEGHTPDMRYSLGIELDEPNFTKHFALLGILLRKNILGEEYGTDRIYGLSKSSLEGTTNIALSSPCRINTKEKIENVIEAVLFSNAELIALKSL